MMLRILQADLLKNKKMKRFIVIIPLCFLGIHTLYAQDLTLALANVQNTNDGIDDYYEAEGMTLVSLL